MYGLPVSVLIDQGGVVQEYIKGGLLTEKIIDQMFRKLKTSDQTAALTGTNA